MVNGGLRELADNLNPISFHCARFQRNRLMLGAALITVAVSGPVLAEPADAPVITAPVVSAPVVTARAAVLLNAKTGELLYAKNPNLRLPPASTTKVLTTLIALETLGLNTPVPVSCNAAAAPPSRLGLKAGEVVSAGDLLYGIMLKSGNDAATAIAEKIGGSVENFATLMNERARQLGAINTHFNNPHGLPDENHYSTAYDLAVIFRQAMKNPLFAEITGTKTSSVEIKSQIKSGGVLRAKMVTVQNHNRLLGTYEGMRGGKTGYTRAARRCFVGEAVRDNASIIVAVLGSRNLWGDAQKLLEYGFEHPGQAVTSGDYVIEDEPEEQGLQKAVIRKVSHRAHHHHTKVMVLRANKHGAYHKHKRSKQVVADSRTERLQKVALTQAHQQVHHSKTKAGSRTGTKAGKATIRRYGAAKKLKGQHSV